MSTEALPVIAGPWKQITRRDVYAVRAKSIEPGMVLLTGIVVATYPLRPKSQEYAIELSSGQVLIEKQDVLVQVFARLAGDLTEDVKAAVQVVRMRKVPRPRD